MQGSHSRGQRVDGVDAATDRGDEDDDDPPPRRTSPETIDKPISWLEGGGFVILGGYRSGEEPDEDVSASVDADTVSWTRPHHDENHRDDRTTTTTTEGTVERDDESGGGTNARDISSCNAPAKNTLASATMMIKNEAHIKTPDPDHYRPARRVRLEIKEVGSPKGRDPVTSHHAANGATPMALFVARTATLATRTAQALR